MSVGPITALPEKRWSWESTTVWGTPKAARLGSTARLRIRAEQLPPMTNPAARPGWRGLRTETLRRRGVRGGFAAGGGVGDLGDDLASAAVGRGDLGGVVAGGEMGGDRGIERGGAGVGEGADVGEGRGKHGGAADVIVFDRAVGAGEKFGAGAASVPGTPRAPRRDRRRGGRRVFA